MELVEGTEVRSAVSREKGKVTTQEIEFLNGAIVRIRTTYVGEATGRASRSVEWSLPAAAQADRIE